MRNFSALLVPIIRQSFFGLALLFAFTAAFTLAAQPFLSERHRRFRRC